MKKVMLVVIMIMITITMVLLTVLSEIKPDLDMEQLERDITEAPYSPEDYIHGIFDCSNMAMLLGQILEEKGYVVVVVVATSWEEDDLVDHVWIVVNGIALVEPTLKKVIQDQDFYWKDYFWRKTYLGTQSLWNHWLEEEGEEETIREWGTYMYSTDN